MKRTFLFALAAAVMVASPALAQTVRRPGAAPQRMYYAPQNTGSWSMGPSVYEGGRYIGTDPDPNVRLDLRRNPEVDSNGG